MIGSQVSGTVPLTTHFSGPPVKDEWKLCCIILVKCNLFLPVNAAESRYFSGCQFGFFLKFCSVLT